MTDFKTEHEEKNQGNLDTDREYYFGVTQVENGAPADGGLSSDQLATLVADRLKLTAPTPQATLNMVIQNNTLVATVANVTGVTYDRHIYILDDATQPDLNDPGWVTGQVPASFTLPAWGQAYAVYLYLTDGVSITHAYADSSGDNGFGGYTIQATDTLPPDWSDATFTVNPDGSFLISPLPVDVATGVTQYDIYDWETDLPVLQDVGANGPADSIALSGGVQRQFFCRAYDGAAIPNTSDSPVSTVIGQVSAGGTFSIKSVPADANVGSLSSVIVQLSGRTDTGTCQCFLNTLNHTAFAGTHYTGLTDFPVVFLEGVTEVQVDVTTLTPSPAEATNLMFESFLTDPTNGATIDTTAVTRYATLHRIIGAGTAEGGYGEVVTGAGVGFIVNMDMDSVLNPGLGGDTVSIVPNSGTGTAVDTGTNAPANVLQHDTVAAYGDNPEYATDAPKCSIALQVDTPDSYAVWLRCLHNQSQSYFTYWSGFNGNPSFGGSFASMTGVAQNTWAWVKINSTASLILGLQTVDFMPRNCRDLMWVNGAIITNDPGFNPNGWEDGLSVKGTLPPTEDPNNPTVPVGGTPPEDLTTGFLLYPSNGASGISISVNPMITFPGMTGVVVSGATATVGGNPISLSWTTNSVDLITFTFDSTLPNDAGGGEGLVSMENLVITIEDGGVRKNVIIGPWTFTTLNPNSGLIEFSQDTNQVPLGVMTPALFAQYYEASSSNREDQVECVDTGIPSRGRALRFFMPQGTYRSSGNFARTFDTPSKEAYFSIDVFVPAGQTWQAGKLGPGFISDTPNAGDVAGGGAATTGFSMRIGFNSPEFISEVAQGVPGTNAISSYSYFEDKTSSNGQSCMLTLPKNTTTHSRIPSGSVAQGLTEGVWHTIKCYSKVNDQFGASANGILQISLDDVLMRDCNTMPWQKDQGDDFNFNKFKLELYIGGATSDYAVDEDTYVYFDNIVLATTNIGVISSGS